MKKIAAAAAALVLIAGLTACGTKTPAPSPSVSVKPTEKPQVSAAAYPIIAESGKTVSADLDGDGKPESVYVDTKNANPDGQPAITSIKVNDTEYVGDLYEGTDFYTVTPDEKHYAITDIDPVDGKLEIAVMDYGPSDDNVTSFFRYESGEIKHIGTISGLLYKEDGGSPDLTFDGKGDIKSYLRLSVLQTWYTDAQWKLGADGNLEPVAQELYKPVGGKTFPVTAKKEVNSYAENNAASDKTVLPVGTALTITGTDNREWVLAEDSKGKQCWLRLTDGGSGIETPSGGAPAGNVLDGLVFAD